MLWLKMKRLLGCRAQLQSRAGGCADFSALPLIPAVARLPDRASVRMGTVEPSAGYIIQHAGESATAPILLDVGALTSLAFAAALRIGNGGKGNDPCREYG